MLFARKYKKQWSDTVLGFLKTASKFLGNKIAYPIIWSNNDKVAKHDENLRYVEEIIIPPEKIDENRRLENGTLDYWEKTRLSTLLNDSTVSKFVTKKWVEVNDLSSGQYSVKKNISL